MASNLHPADLSYNRDVINHTQRRCIKAGGPPIYVSISHSWWWLGFGIGPPQVPGDPQRGGRIGRTTTTLRWVVRDFFVWRSRLHGYHISGAVNPNKYTNIFLIKHGTVSQPAGPTKAKVCIIVALFGAAAKQIQ